MPPLASPPSLDTGPPPAREVRLPLVLTRFFGRETELERITSWLTDPACRLLTLTGPGGSGKTRLAIEAAKRFAGVFDGRVLFVPLADLSAIRRLVRPSTTSLPVVIEKGPPSPRPTERERKVWIADWRVPGSDSSGFRILLDDRSGHVLLVGGDARTGRTATGDGESEGSGAIRTSSEAARTAHRYLVFFGERSAPSPPSIAQHLPDEGFPSGVWRLSLHCADGRRVWMMLDAKSGRLLYFWNLALPQV